MISRLLITPGEPAGIGPEVLCKAAQEVFSGQQLIACGDPALLEAQANSLKLPLQLKTIDWEVPAEEHVAGQLWVDPITLEEAAKPGWLDPKNARYVINTLTLATQRCLAGKAHALVTGPLHKGVINQAGIEFSGHTEFLQAQAKTDKVVMMLATEGLRVCLATTHLPLKDVPAAITETSLIETINVIFTALKKEFGLSEPRLGMCGLNPHAGEMGYLGDEEIKVINPVVQQFRDKGFAISDALPADTLLTPRKIAEFDCILAMYHDQGLPVLKYKGFEQAVNITLGLPFIRTSVDHGTALDVAGKNKASASSLLYAIKTAHQLAQNRV